MFTFLQSDVRIWRRRKLDGIIPERLHDGLDFEVWESNFRLAAKVADFEDLFYDGVQSPKVLAEDESERRFMARNLVLQYLDATYLQYVQHLDNPKEMLEEIRSVREPNTNATGIAAWVALRSYRYNLEKSVAQNVSEYDRIVTRYNACGESLSNRMRRDIFVYTLPTKARQRILSTMRILKKEDATYAKAVNLLHEAERERQLDIKEKERERALVAKEKDRVAKWKRGRSDKIERGRQDNTDIKRRKKTEESNTQDKSHAEERGVCYNCRKPGHIAKNCRSATLKCYSCGKYSNHRAADCPLAKEKEAKEKAIRSFKKGRKLGAANLVDSDGSVSVSTDEEYQSGEYLIIDSGATEHFFGEEKALTKVKTLLEPKSIICANKGKIKLHTSGEVKVKLGGNRTLVLKEAYAHPDFAQNLLSVRKLVGEGYKVIFDDPWAEVIEKKSGKVILKAPLDGKLWRVKVDIICDNDQAFLTVENVGMPGDKVEQENGERQETQKRKLPDKDTRENCKRGKLEYEKEELGVLWHRRLGHANVNYLKYMSTKVEAMRKALFTDKLKDCDDCLRARFVRQPCKKTRERAIRPLQLVHSDVACAFPTSFRNKRTMLVSFIDDHSRYVWIYTIQKKNEVKEMFKLFVDESKRDVGEQYRVGTLRCDNGTEYINEELKEFCKEKGIDIDPCPPYTSQLNGVAERFNRTIQDKIRALLYDSGFPTSMWEYAAAAATYIHNRLPNKSIDLECPYDKYFGKISNVSNLRRFGCLIYTRNTDPQRKKLSEKGVAKFLLGYTSTGYLVLDPNTNCVSSIKHAHPVESKVYRDFKSVKPEDSWHFLDETPEGVDWLKQTVEPDRALEGATKGRGDKELGVDPGWAPEGVTEGEGDKELEVGPSCSSKGVVGVNRVFELPTSEPIHQNLEESNDSEYELEGIEVISNTSDEEGEKGIALMSSKTVPDPKTIAEALERSDHEQWRNAIREEYLSIKNQGTYLVVDKPKGVKIVDSKWVLKVKNGQKGSTYKARLVARGFKLNKEYAKHETFAPVATIGVVRLILALANRKGLPLHQMDVKSAFLNGELDEDIYMYIPEGFSEEIKYKSTKVLKLKKSLYGLQVSPKKWNERFHKVMEELKMTPDGAEPCLYIWREKEEFVTLTIYVDDILITGTNSEMIDRIKHTLQNNFDVKVMGEPQKFLGIEILRNKKNQTLKIGLPQYIKAVVEKYSIGKKKIAPTPMVPEEGEQLVEESEVRGYEKVKFRRVVGCLSFIANSTRPDITYAVNRLSRNQEQPSLHDWKLLKRVIDYLRGSVELGVTYKGEPVKKGKEIECFVDASFASDKTDRKSTSGYLVKVYGDVISWKSKKQAGVSTSSAEAEYIALASGCKEAIVWSGVLGRATGEEIVPIIYEDNKSAEYLAKSKNTGKLKHVDISYHFIKDLIEKRRVILTHIGSEDQTADFLTKPLRKEPFEKCRQECLG